MKVSGVRTFVVQTPPPHKGGKHWIFLKLTTDTGIVGYGEAYPTPFSSRTTALLIEDFCQRFIVGADPFRIEWLWQHMYNSNYSQHPDLTQLAAMTTIEVACWDIVGKALGQPIYNLLGGRIRDKIRSYTYLYAAPDDTSGVHPFWDAKLAGERAAYYVDQGFTAIKYDPLSITEFIPRQLSLADLDNAERVTESVRNAVGSRCDILFGTHGQMTTSSAIRLAKRLEKYDPLWFEEPVPPENVNEMARVARATSIPIATGERLSTKFEFAELLEKQAASILQLEIGRVGGILEAKKIAGMAEAYYAQLAPHIYCGPIASAAAIQLDVCTPNLLIQECIEKLDGFSAEILKEPLRWEDGYIIPPTAPGLGVELNEAVAEKYAAT